MSYEREAYMRRQDADHALIAMRSPVERPRLVPPVRTPLEFYHRALSASEAFSKACAAGEEIGHLECAALIAETELSTVLQMQTGLSLEMLRRIV